MPPALADALASISGPAYVLDRLWNARACNDAARRLFVGWLDGEERQPAALRVPEPGRAARHSRLERAAPAACWRSSAPNSSRHLDDPALVALVDDLRGRSDFFAQCWDEHEVVVPLGGERAFEHPRDGRLTYEQVAFTLASRIDLKLVMLIRRKRRTKREA